MRRFTGPDPTISGMDELLLASSVGGAAVRRCSLEGALAVAYRKAKGSDTWHYCTNCSKWPTSNYDQSAGKPTTGELCNECKGKEKNGQCQR